MLSFISELRLVVYRSPALKITTHLPSGIIVFFKTIRFKCSSESTLELQEQSHN